MRREYHRWYSSRMGLIWAWWCMGIMGSRWSGFRRVPAMSGSLKNQGMIGALGDFIEAGRMKVFSVNSVNGAGCYNSGRASVSSELDAGDV